MAALLSLDLCQRFCDLAGQSATATATARAAQALTVRMARELVGDAVLDDEACVTRAGALVTESLAAWQAPAVEGAATSGG